MLTSASDKCDPADGGEGVDADDDGLVLFVLTHAGYQRQTGGSRRRQKTGLARGTNHEGTNETDNLDSETGHIDDCNDQIEQGHFARLWKEPA